MDSFSPSQPEQRCLASILAFQRWEHYILRQPVPPDASFFSGKAFLMFTPKLPLRTATHPHHPSDHTEPPQDSHIQIFPTAAGCSQEQTRCWSFCRSILAAASAVSHMIRVLNFFLILDHFLWTCSSDLHMCFKAWWALWLVSLKQSKRTFKLPSL